MTAGPASTPGPAAQPRPWTAPISPAIRLGLSAVSLAPPRLGYGIADVIMAVLASRPRSPIVRTIRANQAVLRGLTADDPSLGEISRRVLRHAGRGYVDWLRALAGGKPVVELSCRIEPPAEAALRRALERRRGLVLVGPHLNGFNLVILRLATLDTHPLVLTPPRVQGIHLLENALRQRFGVRVEAADLAGLRAAFRALERGHIVATGVDRPDPSGRELHFLGRRAMLPVGHARLALQAQAPVFAAGVVSLGDGIYSMRGEIIEVGSWAKGKETQAIELAQTVATSIEAQIRAAPDAWLMFHRLWPR